MHSRRHLNTLKYRSTQSGVSVLDLLISTSIFCILTAIAIPSFKYVLKLKKQEVITHHTLRLLNYARQEAVNRTSRVILCATENEQKCSSDWTNPLMVFVDQNENDELDQDELLLRKETLLGTNQHLSWVSFGGKAYVGFNESGTTGYQSGRIYYCDLSDPDRYKSQVIVYRTGRSRIAPKSELRGGCGD